MSETDTQAAVADLREALGALGVPVLTGSVESTLTVRAGEAPLSLRVRTSAAPTPAWVATNATPSDPATNTLSVLVADRISAGARQALADRGWGWLDRRGHLRLFAPPLIVDTAVPSLRAPQRARSDVLRTTVGLEVATELLMAPDEPARVRPLARQLGRAPSSVSAALRGLREQALVRDDRRPLVPELFWAVAGEWRPDAIALAGRPEPLDAHRAGWAVTGTLAALTYGAPVVASSDYPPDFYVSTKQDARTALNRYGPAPTFGHRSSTIAVAPVGAACTRRLPPKTLATAQQWPLAHPVFVALDLARDRARGAEILEAWDPPEGFHRVW